MRTAIRKTFYSLSSVIILISAALYPSTVLAQDTLPGVAEVKVSYEGEGYNKSIFSLNFNNNSGKAVTISIADKYGIELYQESSKKAQYTRKFMLDDELPQDIELVISISDRDLRFNKSYTIKPDLLVKRSASAVRL